MKIIKKYLNRYFIDGFGAMALGLFSTLIIGTILSQIAAFISNDFIKTYILFAANMAKTVTGAGIGVAVAVKFGASPLLTAAAGACGMLGAFPTLPNALIDNSNVTYLVFGKPGEPLGAFIAAVFAIEFGRLVSGKTKLDIILTPLVAIVCGSAAAFLLSSPISSFMNWLGQLVNVNVDKSPIIGGIIVSVLMGIFLTLPISSAAIGVSMGLSGLAAGAACVGCCCQMVGFAVISYKDNKIGGLIAQGVGTSMLQIPNIMKKPIIWTAPILSSAILGPISSAVIKMTNTPSGSGMGTSGIVGPLQAYQSMAMGENPLFSPISAVIWIVLMCVIFPIILNLLFDFILRKTGLIKKGDMLLPSLSK